MIIITTNYLLLLIGTIFIGVGAYFMFKKRGQDDESNS